MDMYMECTRNEGKHFKNILNTKRFYIIWQRVVGWKIRKSLEPVVRIGSGEKSRFAKVRDPGFWILRFVI